MADTDEEESNDTTISGIEELPDNSLDSSTTEPLQENSDAEGNQEQKSTADEKPPRPQPRRKLTLKSLKLLVHLNKQSCLFSSHEEESHTWERCRLIT